MTMRTCMSGRNTMKHTSQWSIGDESNWETNTRTATSSNWCLLPSLCGKCCPRCLLPSLCGECICPGLSFATHRLAKSEAVPNITKQNQMWLPNPRLLGGAKEGGSTTSPLHSQGSPTKGSKIRSGCLTPAFAGAQNMAQMLRHTCILGDTRQRKQNQMWLPHPWPLGGPKEGGNTTSPLHSRGSPQKRNKIRPGCPTPAFSGAQKRAEVLPHPYIFGDPLQKGTKSEVAASALPPRRPKRERKCYVTPAFSGIPNAKHR